MELSDVAKSLWKRLNLDWPVVSRRASEHYAKFYVRGALDSNRLIEFIGEQGLNKVSTLNYFEKGYGFNDDFGGICVHTSPKSDSIGVFYDVAAHAHKELLARLERTDEVGVRLRNAMPVSRTKESVISHFLVPSLEVVEPFFLKFMESSGYSQQFR